MLPATAAKNSDRKVFWAVLGTVALAGLLVVGTYYALQLAREHELRAKAQSDVRAWGEHLVDHTPGLPGLLAGQPASPAQQSAFHMAHSYGGVQGFSLFSLDGTQIVGHGNMPQRLTEQATLDAVQQAAANGTLHIWFEDVPDTSLHNVVDSVAILPLFADDGTQIGVAKQRTRHTSTAVSLSTVTGLVVMGVPILSAFAFLLPMLITIRITRKAKLREQELANLSRQDALTGLMNRNGIAGKIRPLFADRRDPAEQIGIILVDLDNFKAVNDIYSPAVADAYLCETANRLLRIAGAAGFVGRMNGDEFMLVLPTTTREALRRCADEVQHAIAAPCPIDGQQVQCTACIGLHLSPVGQPVDRALHAADLALNKAISDGYGQTVEYVDALDQVTGRHNQIESYLRSVGFDHAVEVYFQPFVDAETGQVNGFEALARLRDEQGNIVGPDEFIPVAESTGMIHELGKVVLRKAMRAARKWPAPIYISVNLSPVQFQNSNLANDIIADLDRIGLAPERLELELTESLLLQDEEGVSAVLQRLRHAGISVAMDDFGTGYSSLGYLWKYHFNKLKIDKSFLSGHDFEEGRYFDIIETIILLGHKLGMSVTVEGVETRRQVEVLTAMSCDQFQGFYFARPLTLEQANAVVQSLYAPIPKSA
ncbi:putative bifunctional diguanylate cyclase/phosphodiesterase [Yoonia sp. R2331]|uniref:putative bifunctional diguanylate cyclase/phosphodiesterase n=1 Tax=Yoonia sp. R2331 TaxID=3237238 RepID=UPI0034E4A228